MKKMIAILLALLMMLSGMATAEETTDNNTNISHMLELCQRVDILLRSDRMVSDWVDGADTAITEEQKIVNRLRVGNRTVPSAVYYVAGERCWQASSAITRITPTRRSSAGCFS